MVRSITEVAVSLLARREHSTLELRQKLKHRGFSEVDVEDVVEQLLTNNLLSDERFTETYINMRKHRGFGPLRIANELRERGVGADLIDQYLDKNSAEWRVVMQRQYAKKYGDEQAGDYAEKAKRAKYLQNRGFPLGWVFKLDSLEEYEC